MGKIKRFSVVVFALILPMMLTSPQHVMAQLTSPNYRAEETFFGTGGELDASSTNYRSRQSAGSLGVGDANSPSYRINAGATTQADPYLEVGVSNATVNFGNLSDSSTSSGAAQADACNCSFYVKSYLSSGYVVVTVSQPPTNESGDSLDAKTTLGVPSTDPGVEEFGINLVDNTSPDIGANLSNDPDGTFADGKVSTGYSTPDQFKYNVGDIIAESPGTAGNQGIGKTNYTISYIAKIKTITPAGFYSMSHDFVVVPTF